MSDEATVHPGALLAVLADERRLRCLSAIVLGAGSEAEVSAAAALDAASVKRAVSRLVSAGLVERTGDGRLRALTEQFGRGARVAARMRPEITPEDLGASPEQAAGLRGFFDDGRLVAIPVARGKRLAVLDFLAQQFVPGRTYPEREVNAILGRFHPDYAALRRYLVDEEFLQRREGAYWRVGGTFDIK